MVFELPSRFGDIATMEWWDYLYLNEGFATLVCVHFHIFRNYLHTIKMGEVIVVGMSSPFCSVLC